MVMEDLIKIIREPALYNLRLSSMAQRLFTWPVKFAAISLASSLYMHAQIQLLAYGPEFWAVKPHCPVSLAES